MSLLLPQQASAEELPQPALNTGTFAQTGPGQYSSSDDTYRVSENDLPIGLMGRVHSVTGQSQGVAQAQDAPSTRSDLGVFGPSWEAEFLGGQLQRSLSVSGDKLTTTALDTGEKTVYSLTETLDAPFGGHVKTYTAADGSTAVDSTVWDDLAGELKTSVVETTNVDLTNAYGTGDGAPKDALGSPIAAADLKPTFTWKQVGGGGDNWRIVSAGSKETKSATVLYDAQGRVSQVKEPALGDKPAATVKVSYATATTASGETLGDVAGQVKEISATIGTTTQTLARYEYDGGKLLRKVTNPSAGEDLNVYTYDAQERLATATTDGGDKWQLTFAGDEAAPAAVDLTGKVAGPEAPMDQTPSVAQGDDGAAPPAEGFSETELNTPYANPRYCNTAESWMYLWYTSCATKVAHYGWRYPYFFNTPTGKRVVGIYNDYCTDSLDTPMGWNFKPACASHDYGYGTIGNAWKRYTWYLDYNKGLAVDYAFYGQLYHYTCPDYFFTTACRNTAYTYYRFVVKYGSPLNGANATR
ncbi:phospholipase [Streptomyces sp. SA15]|uniref:phospholipase n=1 Tax=Streptomyces sp. SA15 TaxID=934019 RepID=UPI00211BEBD5|nr:phospholipase [Streptomyces sp. SA15]